MKKLLLFVLLLIANAGNAQCAPPSMLSALPDSFFVTLNWAGPQGASYDVVISPAGAPAPVEGSVPSSVATSSPFTFAGLVCSTVYQFYVRSVCPGNTNSVWVGPFMFQTMNCGDIAPPQNFSACPVNGEACFDLHLNDANILVANPNPTNYEIKYFGSYEDAESNTGEITTDVCLSSGTLIFYARIREVSTNIISIMDFDVSVQTQNCTGILMNAFLDGNANGIQDAGENNFPFGQFSYELNNDGSPQYISTSNGTYNVYDSNTANSYDLGFTLNADTASYYGITTSNFPDVNAPAAGFSTYNFPVVATAVYHDASVSIASYAAPRPGFDYFIAINYTNTGNQTESGTVAFTMPSELTFIDAMPSAGGSVSTTANGFTYDFTNLAPFTTELIVVHLQVALLPSVTIGQTLQTSVSVTIASDVIAINNSAILNDIVIGSYDPNDKMEAHGPQIVTNTFGLNEELTYTIRFENTGTAEAINVKITDELDGMLDASTARMIASSHNVIMQRNGQNLTWRFNSINLPPVSPNDLMSGHGYVTFAVKPSAAVFTGNVIPNTASIYFDYNPAIVTNTFETEFVDVLASQAFEDDLFALYPNPTRNAFTIQSAQKLESIVLYDVMGKKVLEVYANGQTQQTIDTGKLAPGVYLVEIISDLNQRTIKKLIKQ